MNKSMTELIKAKEIKPAELFAGDESVDAILNQITLKARDMCALPSTASGRKTIASVAHRVARSKTLLDDMGKDLVRDIKAQVGEVDARRRKIRHVLDALKHEVRLPLTKWENREKNRVAIIETKIVEMRALFYHPINDLVLTADQLDERRNKLLAFDVDNSFEEFKRQAETNKQEQVAILTKVEANTRKADEESERLRKAEEALAQAKLKAQAAADEESERLRKAEEEVALAQAKLKAQAAADEETEKRVGVEGSGAVVRGSKVGGVSGGNNEVSDSDYVEEADVQGELDSGDGETQAQEGSPAQEAQEDPGVEERAPFDPSVRVDVAQSDGATPASPQGMAAHDLVRFGATPVIADMLVVAIQLGQVRCVRFVGEC